jgi:hypothetical protein
MTDMDSDTAMPGECRSTNSPADGEVSGPGSNVVAV